MNEIFSSERMNSMIDAVRSWIDENVLDPAALVQLCVILVCFLFSLALAAKLRSVLERIAAREGASARVSALARTLATLALPMIWLALQWIALLAAGVLKQPDWLLELTTSLLAAYIVIRLAGSFIRDPLLARTVEIAAWTVAALNILDLFEPTVKLLDAVAFTIGSVRLSALGLIKGVFVLAVLLWAATLISEFLERRIRGAKNLTPSVQELFSKALKVTFIAIAIVAGINAVGIDLTAFAVFTGALGVGIGFGLQKVVSNLVSGMILLLDRSIKPGDVITVGNTFGWVNQMGARYVSLLTRDGIEHLVPNEDLITQRVENWSYSNNEVRMRIGFGVHYDADIHKARELAIEAAMENDRVLKTPSPVCNLTEFGDSSVNFELRVWINDPQNGTGNVRGQILTALWDRLHTHSIEIPYPQRDLHWRSSEPITVRIAGTPPSSPPAGPESE